MDKHDGMHQVLTDLAHETLEVSRSPEHQRRRRLWARLHALQPERALASYAMYHHVWERDIACQADLRCEAGLARQIEVQLRARLWKARNIPDDEPLLPTVWLGCPHPVGESCLWGVPLSSRRTSETGSYKPVPPLADRPDVFLLRRPPYEEMPSEKQALIEECQELLGGLLPVKLQTDELHYGPFEWAVRLRGMDNLLLDVVDRPEFVHDIMDAITYGMESYHTAREAAGAVDAEQIWPIHMHYDDVPAGMQNRLKGCWAYVHAQSAASLSPAMYAEFVQPYNERIAAMFGKVYYHGCEDLSAKAPIIRALPNLRLFHVGPWTPLAPVLETFGGSVALEVHSHPAKVLEEFSREDIRRDVRDLHAQASGAPHTLKLCDVEAVRDRGEKLRIWAEEARAAVED